MIEKKSERRYFESLDLVRGLAALVVLIYHADFMFGLRHKLLPGGYLAVDLFFVLSGFVLSLNYGPKIAAGTLSLRSYAVARFARLYPLFAATTAIGFFVMTTRYKTNFGYFDTVRLIEAALTNIVMLPGFAGIYNMTTSFPFNPASWSIFFELVASFLFFFYFGRVGWVALCVIAAIASVILAAVIVFMGTVDLGYASENCLAGFPRVIFSFTVGILIQRAFARAPWQFSPALLYVTLVLVFGFIQLRVLLSNAEVFDIVAVGILLPLLVVISAGVSLKGRVRQVAVFMGEISYAVYLTQGVLIITAAGMAQYFTGYKIYDLGAWVGFVFVICAMAFSYVTYRFFELPARTFLRRMAVPEVLESTDRFSPGVERSPRA